MVDSNIADLALRTAKFLRGEVPENIYGLAINTNTVGESELLAKLADRGMVLYDYSKGCEEVSRNSEDVREIIEKVMSGGEYEIWESDTYAPITDDFREEDSTTHPGWIKHHKATIEGIYKELVSVNITRPNFYTFICDSRCNQLLESAVILHDKYQVDVTISSVMDLVNQVKTFPSRSVKWTVTTKSHGTFESSDEEYSSQNFYDMLHNLQGNQRAIYQNLLTDAYVVHYQEVSAGCKSFQDMLQIIFDVIIDRLPKVVLPVKIESKAKLLLKNIGVAPDMLQRVDLSKPGWTISLLEGIKLLPLRQRIERCNGCYVYMSQIYLGLCTILALQRPGPQTLLTRDIWLYGDTPVNKTFRYPKSHRVLLFNAVVADTANDPATYLKTFINSPTHNQLIMPLYISASAFERNGNHMVLFIAVKDETKRQIFFTVDDSNIDFGTIYWGKYFEDMWPKITSSYSLGHLPTVHFKVMDRPVFRSPQDLESLKHYSSEPEGYCATWSFMFACISILSGIVDRNEILTDVVAWFQGNYPLIFNDKGFSVYTLTDLFRDLVRAVSTNEFLNVTALFPPKSSDELSRLCCRP
jgi:hypothetical protein